jgi:hypothetical protein
MTDMDQCADSEGQWRDVLIEIEHARHEYSDRLRADAQQAELVRSWLRLCRAERKRADLLIAGA